MQRDYDHIALQTWVSVVKGEVKAINRLVPKIILIYLW